MIAQRLNGAREHDASCSLVWRSDPGPGFYFRGSSIQEVGDDAFSVFIEAKTTGAGPNERTERAHYLVIPFHSILNLSITP